MLKLLNFILKIIMLIALVVFLISYNVLDKTDCDKCNISISNLVKDYEDFCLKTTYYPEPTIVLTEHSPQKLPGVIYDRYSEPLVLNNSNP
jgi:hypothetical protein